MFREYGCYTLPRSPSQGYVISYMNDKHSLRKSSKRQAMINVLLNDVSGRNVGFGFVHRFARCWSCSRLVTYSILLRWLFAIKDQWKKCVLYHHNFGHTRCLKAHLKRKPAFKVCVRCFWQGTGPSASSAAHLTVFLFLCSSRSNAQGKSRALEGRRVSSKSPSRV